MDLAQDTHNYSSLSLTLYINTNCHLNFLHNTYAAHPFVCLPNLSSRHKVSKLHVRRSLSIILKKVLQETERANKWLHLEP